jgi:hypothetical protein
LRIVYGRRGDFFMDETTERMLRWVKGKGGFQDWPVDMQIKPLIALLNSCGIETNTSCSGIISEHRGRHWQGMGTPYVCYERLKSRKFKKQTDDIFETAGFDTIDDKTETCHYYALTETDDRAGHPSDPYKVLDAIPEKHIVRAWDELFTNFLSLCIKKQGRKK